MAARSTGGPLSACWHVRIGPHLLLGAVLLLALLLRLQGLNWGLPWAFHPDEIFYADQAQDILRFGDPNPKYFKNPSLLTYLIAVELLVSRALGPLAGPLALTEPGSAYLLARLDSATLGTASVALLYLLGRRLFDQTVGLLAALLLAVSFLHARDSHYGVNDVPATALLLLSLYFCAGLLREPSVRGALLAGFSGGLATSTKYNMGFFFVPILVAMALATWTGTRDQTGRAPRQVILRGVLLVAAAAASLVGYLLGTPYTVVDFGRFQADFVTQYGFGNQRWLGQPLTPVPLLYLATLCQGFGALPLAAAGVGLVVAWSRYRAAVVVLIAFPLAYLAFLLPKPLFFPRFALPLIPVLALLAAYGLADLRRRWPVFDKPVVFAPLLLAVVLQPFGNSVLHNWMLAQTDTRVQANVWVQANLPPGSRLKVEDYSLRDLSTGGRTYTPNTANLRIERFEGSPEAEQARYFVERNVQYVVTSSFAFDRYLLDPPSASQKEAGQRYERLHRSLDQRAEVVARFSPGHANSVLIYRLDDVMTPFWSLEEYERPGPTIRIYSLANVATG